MAYLFENLDEQAEKKNIVGKRRAREWFRTEAGKIKQVNTTKLMAGKKDMRDQIGPRSTGKLYMFFYEPKHRQTLPYYDRFPLVFPIKYMRDGFLGINLHYLPPVLRAKLMNALYTTLNNERMDGTTRLRINYQILNSATRFRLFRPCIKRYLNVHVQQQFLQIPPKDWDKALLLPCERFQKRSKGYVWDRTVEKLGIR